MRHDRNDHKRARAQLLKWTAVTALLATAAAASSCTVPDEDRCPAGHTYLAKLNACCPEDYVDENNLEICREPADTPTDTDAPTGWQLPCTSQEGCAPYEASYCALNPMTGEGVCTLEDCSTGTCPTGSKCCDCTEVGQAKMCVADEGVAQAEAFCGPCD